MSLSEVLRTHSMKAGALIVLGIALGCHDHSALAQPSAAQVLGEMGWSAGDQQRVLNGEFVTIEGAEASDKDLALSIAFLVRTTPADLSQQVIGGRLIDTDPQVVASGEFSGTGSLADLAALHVDDQTLGAFLNARPGEALNLSAAEISAFDALRSAGSDAALPQLRQMLLARFKAYKASGLAGIAPYARGGGTSDVAGELRKATNALTLMHKYMPVLEQTLLGYPRVTVPGMRDAFRWVQYNIDGTTTLVLMHELTASNGAVHAVVQRQYYVSTGYNTEQAVAGFLPVQGGTVVAYTNHTFTDQVAGFGGGMKRSIGRRMMASKLTQMFETGRTRVDRE